MPKPSDLRSGSIIRFNGELCIIMEIIHRTPGNLRAFYQAKMKNLKTGKQAEYRYRADEDVEMVRVEARQYQYLYMDGDSYICMHPESYEQIPVPGEMFGESKRFLKENMEVTINFEEDTILSAEAPNFVELEVTYTEPGLKGDTVNNVLKPATLETGAEIKVPIFVNIGDRLKVDTRTGEYMERAK